MSDQNVHTLVYRYHCEPASDADAAALCAQLHLATEYRRELAMIENRHRALQRAWGVRYAACTVERRESQKDKALWATVNSAAKASAAERTPFSTSRQQLMSFGLSSSLAEAMLDLATVNGARADAARAARARAVARGLTWGTYQHSEEAFAAQCRTTPIIDNVRIPPYASIAGATGCFAVHMQPARALRGQSDNWFRVGEIERRGSEIDRSGRIRPARHHRVDLRIGSQDDRSPRWVSVLALISRPLPVGAAVRWAMVKRRRIGPMFRWELLVVIDIDEAHDPVHRDHELSAFRLWAAGASKRAIARSLTLHIRDARLLAAAAERAGITQGCLPDGLRSLNDALIDRATCALNEMRRERRAATRGDAVGVDIGWRQVEGGTRIAYWWGTDGRSGELIIGESVLGADKFADEVRSWRANNLNAMRSQIIAYTMALRDAGQAPWLLEETSSIALWRRAARFVMLMYRWRDQRIEGDDDLFLALEAWQRHDRRLWAWEAGIRDKRRRQVDEQIRVLVAKLCREYSIIALETPFIASMVRKPKRCQECEELTRRCADCQERERLRQLASKRVPHAAPARTRQMFQGTASRRGARVVEIDPAYTTIDCSSCGHRRSDVEDWSVLHIGCSRCGATEDQDLTAAKNLAHAVVDPDRGRSDDRPARRKLGPRINRKKVTLPSDSLGSS